MKIFFKIASFFLIIIILIVFYLSIVGVETTKFNKQIQNKIQYFDSNLSLELKKIKLILNPLKLNITAKTLGAKIIKQNEDLELENIKTSISLKSLISNEFLIEKVEISTKFIEISNLISFARLIYQIPELIFFEKLFNVKGYVIANIKVEFNKNGSLKDNYIIEGFIKDTKASFFKNYKLSKLNFKFDLTKDNINLSNLNAKFNNLDLKSNLISAKKINNGYLVKGNIENDVIELNDKDFIFLKEKIFKETDIKKIKFSSKNDFSLKINKKLQLKDTKIKSKINLYEAQILKKMNLKEIFPEFKNNISILNQTIDLNYKKDFLSINGNGKILIQKSEDLISYKIEKNKDKLIFKNTFKINKNPFLIRSLNYKKKNDTETIIKFNGHKDKKNKIYIQSASIGEKKNKMEIKNIYFDKNFKIEKFDNISLNYFDKDNKKNLIKVYKDKNKYILKGDYFNSDNLIQNILFNDKQSNYFSKDFEIDLNIKKVLLDEEFFLDNLNGSLYFKNQKLFDGKLKGHFPDNKKMVFTIKTIKNEKITTFFIDHAKPIVKRYKFIKGFDGGILDFYSSKKDSASKSTLKIYNFKLKELPTLTKILTLASLQGIADILSGEGIRFEEFEMNFENKEKLITIDEIYAIGPAISILMSGYVEKDKLVSLRGTLVPATTINKAIGSIPVLGKILVGTKTGEGVFGVSFKIKGPPKNLETAVNPIKTLTPRFITRTLEKIKETN